MALKVWLQFKDKLQNCGTEEVNISKVENANVIANGKVGGALATTTSSQGISLNDFMPIFSTYKNYSCSAWVFIDDAPKGHSATIFSSGDWNEGKSQCCFGFFNYSGGVYKTLLVPNKSGWSSGIALTHPIGLNKWYHIAISYDGSVTKAYINGKYEGTYNGGGITATSNNNNLYVGRPTYTSYFSLNGQISDVRIYDKALSAKEIKEISKGLLLNYSFNEDINLKSDDPNANDFHFKDKIIYDNSGLCNHGEYVGDIKTVSGSINGDKCYYWGNTSKCAGYIKSNTLHFDGENCTLNAWIKLNGVPGGGTYHMPLEGASGSTFEMSISSDGKLRGGMVINSTRYVQNCANPNMNDKKWHMITISYDGNKVHRYVDGVEYISSTIKGKTKLDSSFYMGQYGTSASYFSKDMYESDVRIYATALSLEDIQQMYKVRTLIDNKNNVHSFQFEETSENLLKREYTIENCNTPRIDSTCGTWGKRNGVNCMKFGAPDYYFGGDDPRTGKMLLGHFEEGKQYLFDLWLDVDDLTYKEKNVVGGFIAIYTDGSTKQLIATGDAKNKRGFQHIHYVSTKGKTLKSMSIYYYVGTTFYVRWDSSIVKYSGQNIKKNGILKTAEFVENIETNENVKFFKGGVIKTSELDKI